MQKTESRMIDGVEYCVTQLPPFTALPLGWRVLRAFAPAMDALLSGAKFRFRDVNIGMVAEMSSRVDPQEFAGIVSGLLSSVVAIVQQSNGQSIRLELIDPNIVQQHFHGRLDTLLKVAVFANEVNFANFFAAALSAEEETEEAESAAQKSVESNETTQSSSTAGLPGDSLSKDGAPLEKSMRSPSMKLPRRTTRSTRGGS